MTKRALLIGLVFVVLLCAVIPYNDYYLRNTYITGNHFPLGAVVVLTALVLVVNIGLRYVRPRSQLRPGELMVIGIMIIGDSLCGAIWIILGFIVQLNSPIRILPG